MASRRNRPRTAKLCRNFVLGHCPQGDSCKYIHQFPTETVSASSSQYSTALSSFPKSRFTLPTAQTLLNQAQWQPALALTQNFMSMQPQWMNSTSSNRLTQQIPSVGAPQFKPLSWRTSLCRHFTKNRGWCPMGDECNYIHDLELADIALEDARFPNMRVPPTSSADENRGKAGSKHSHCWAYVQGLCNVKDCPYLHPVAVHHFVRHTPCLSWPNCNKGVLCDYKHPEPIIRKVPLLPQSFERAPAPAPRGQPPSVQPPSSVVNPLSQAYQYRGTTYFPLIPQAPVSPTAGGTSRPPIQPHPFVSSYPAAPLDPRQPSGSPPWQAAMSPVFSQVQASPQYVLGAQLGYQAGYGPSATSPPWLNALIYESDTPANALLLQRSQEGGSRDPSVPRSSAVYQSLMSSFSQLADSTGENEFPYVPPKIQRVGHARRVSVALKSKEDTDALGLSVGPPARAPWQTHGGRNTNKSWAPSSSGNFL